MSRVRAFQLAVLIPILLLSHTVSEAQSLCAPAALGATTYSTTRSNTTGNSPVSVVPIVNNLSLQDLIPPAGCVKINGNAAYTGSMPVTLALAATDNVGVTGYYVSMNPTPPAAGATGWVAVASAASFGANVPFNLSGGDGTKTVYAWFKDAAGNVSAAAADSIVLDQTPPTTASNASAGWVGTDQTVALTPSDGTGSGVAVTQYCTDTANSCTPGTTGISVAVNCAAGATCQTYVRYRSTDQVGNVEATQSALVRIDKGAPTNGSLTAAPGNAQVALSWSGFSDGGSGLATTNTYKLVYASGAAPASCAVGTQLLLGTATSFTNAGLTNGATYSYRVCASDVTANISTGATASATPQAPVTFNPTLVGFVPGVGKARDVVVDQAKGLAYVASDEFGLAVVDVTHPAAPVVLGATIPPFLGQKLAVSGSLAVVTGAGWGMAVVDITDPFNPTPISLLSGEMGGVAMAGQYAYVLLWVTGNPGHYDLGVIDLRVPTAPAILGRVTVAGGGGLKVVGSLAYVAAGSAGLQIVDVSNPAAPWIIRTADTPGAAKGVALVNGYAYVADNTSIQVISVADPNNPFIAGSLATAANSVAVAGARLYAISGSQFKVIDVANPLAPLLLSATDSLGAQGVAAAGSLAFLASPSVDRELDKGGLYVVDVSIPTAPAILASALGGMSVTGVAAAGPLAAVVGASGLQVVNVSDAFNPDPIGVLSGGMGGVAMAGQYAYVLLWVTGNPGHYDLGVIDLRVPTAPAILGRITVGAGGGLKVVGSLAYVATGSTGLQIVNVSNPLAPWIVSTVDTPGGAKGVAVANGYAYVADNTSVQIIRVTDPSNPVVVGSLATAAIEVVVAGTRLYALSGSQFKVIDVTNPASPVLLSATNGYGAQGFDVTGTLAFLASPSADASSPTRGVYVLDVSNAAQPALVEKIVVPGLTRTIFATSTFVYAGDEAAILDVIQLGP